MTTIYHDIVAVRRAFEASHDALTTPKELKALYKHELKRSSVLVPLFFDRQDGKVKLLFTKRALHLKHHPGQISFPGGRQEDTDRDAIHTALRETEEEIGIGAEQVEIIGHLPQQPTATGFVIEPIVGIIKEPIDFQGLTVCADEVAEVFSVSLEFLFDKNNRNIMHREYKGHKYTLYSIIYQEHDIWGATAGLIMQLAKRLTSTRD